MNPQPNADFLKKLMATFLLEAREHEQALGTGVLELEKTPSQEAQLPLVETLFREAHSLKGAARSVNAGEIERLCQAMEGTFAEIKSGKREISADALDGLHRDVAVLGQLIDTLETGTTNAESGARNAEAGKTPPSDLPPSAAPRSAFRVRTFRLQRLFVSPPPNSMPFSYRPRKCWR